MEAASIPVRPSPMVRARALLGQYGLIAVLLALPVFYAIKDLTGDQGNLTRLGDNS